MRNISSTNASDTRGGWSRLDQLEYENNRYQKALVAIRKMTRSKKIKALIDEALGKDSE